MRIVPFVPLLLLVACASGGSTVLPPHDGAMLDATDSAFVIADAALDSDRADAARIDSAMDGVVVTDDATIDALVVDSGTTDSRLLSDTSLDAVTLPDVALVDASRTDVASGCLPLVTSTFSGSLAAASWQRPETPISNPQSLVCPFQRGFAEVSLQTWVFCNPSVRVQRATFEVIVGTNGPNDSMLFAYDGIGIPSNVGMCRVANDDRASNSRSPALFDVDVAAGAALTVVVSGFAPSAAGPYEFRVTVP